MDLILLISILDELLNYLANFTSLTATVYRMFALTNLRPQAHLLPIVLLRSLLPHEQLIAVTREVRGLGLGPRAAPGVRAGRRVQFRVLQRLITSRALGSSAIASLLASLLASDAVCGVLLR